MRRIVAMLGAALLALPHAVLGQPVTAQTQKNTYLFGLKCYVANAVASSDPRFNADGSKSDYYKGKAQKSYEVIFYMGHALGTSDDLIREDIESYERLWRATYLKNDAFFQQVTHECAKIGLM